MKRNATYIIVILMTFALMIVSAASATAGGSAGKMSRYETVEGVLSIKESHGDFLVRTDAGKTQRFSVKGNMEITRNGEPAHYSDLKTNDSIAVKYDPSNREVIAIQASGS
jgi:hypothetical protein